MYDAHSAEEVSFTSTEDLGHAVDAGLRAFVDSAVAAGNGDKLTERCQRFPFICTIEPESKELIREFAMSIAKERLLERDVDDYVDTVQTILPRLTAEDIAMLPAPGARGAVDSDGSVVPLEQEDAVMAYTKSMKVMEDVVNGAISLSGAFPAQTDVQEWVGEAKRHRVDKRKHTYRTLFIGIEEGLDPKYLIALHHREGEVAAHNTSSLIQDGAKQEEMEDWFVAGGGKMNFAEPAHTDSMNSSTRFTGLETLEAVGDQDEVLKVPVELTMSQHTLKMVKYRDTRKLSDKMKPVFQRNQVWGLTAFFLYEHAKGKDSKWWPFLQNLRMKLLRKEVVAELRGTSAEGLLKAWDQDAEHMMSFLRKHDSLGCGHDFDNVCGNMDSLAKIRWGLAIVRANAVWINRPTTTGRFLALVPYAHLLKHAPGSTSRMVLHFDNHIRLHAGEHPAGVMLGMDKGPVSNCESLLLFHEVPEDNPEDGVRLFLPGVPVDNHDLYLFLDTLIEWRRLLRYPPKSGDLWDASRKLHLYGDEFDEDEEKAMEAANKLLAGQRVQVENSEQHLLLLGAADSKAEAQALILAETNPLAAKYAPSHAQLYAAAKPESDDDDVAKAQRAMSNAALELQDAIAADHDEPSVLKTLNRTTAFYNDGVRPRPGMDEVDKLMKRKKELLSDCGNGADHKVKYGNITSQLLCAVRTHIIHETELDFLCPPGPHPFHDHECNCDDFPPAGGCEGSHKSFNTSQAITVANEEKTLEALLNVIQDMRESSPGTIESDQAALAAARRSKAGPLRTAAIAIRLREKEILEEAVRVVKGLQANMNSSDFQVEAIMQEQAAAEALRLQRLESLKEYAARGKADRIAYSINVTLDDAQTGALKEVPLRVRKGKDLDELVRKFAMKYALTEAGAQSLKASLIERAPTVEPYQATATTVVPGGFRKTLVIAQGANTTEAVYEFAAVNNITQGEPLETHAGVQHLLSVMEAKVAARAKRQPLLVVPVDGPDGRKLHFEVRQGEQHDIYDTALQFVNAYGIHNSFAETIANAAHQRMPQQLAEFPVNMGSMSPPFRVRAGDDLTVTIQGFIDMYGLADNAMVAIRTQAASMLPPGSPVRGLEGADDDEEEDF